MNPIAMFKGWRDRRWCERWTRKQPHGCRCVSVWKLVKFGTWGYSATTIEHSPDDDVLAEEYDAPTRWHAWSALRRELEKQ